MKKKTNVINQKVNIKRVALITAVVLLIPVIGRFPWGIFDYVFMGLLIFATGCLLDWVARNVEAKYRVVVAAAILFVFFLVWAELAVGLISQLLTGDLWIFDFIRR